QLAKRSHFRESLQSSLPGIRVLSFVLRGRDIAKRNAAIMVGGADQTIEIELARHRVASIYYRQLISSRANSEGDVLSVPRDKSSVFSSRFRHAAKSISRRGPSRASLSRRPRRADSVTHLAPAAGTRFCIWERPRFRRPCRQRWRTGETSAACWSRTSAAW